jgi:hypothetical protein
MGARDLMFGSLDAFDYVEFVIVFVALCWFVSTRVVGDLPEDFLPRLSDWVAKERKRIQAEKLKGKGK